MASKKKANNSKKNTKKKQDTGFKFKAEIVFIISILLLFFSVLKLDSFWSTIHFFILGVFGFTAFPVFILSGYTAARVAIDKFDSSTNVRVVFEGIFIYLFSVTFNIFSFDPALSYGDFLMRCYERGVTGGGLLGGLLSYPFASVFSKTGAAIILILILVVIFLFVAGISLKQIVEAFSGSADKIKNNTRRFMDERRIKEEQVEQARREELFERKETRPEDYDISLAGFHNQKPNEQDISSYEQTSLHNEEPKALEDIIKDAVNDRQSEPRQKKPVKSAKASDSAKEKEENTALEGGNTSGITVQPETVKEYRYPPLSLLEEGNSDTDLNIGDELKQNAELLVDTLKSFGVETRIINISRGPSVTRYELQPAAGVKISRITNLADDIALNLATVGVRIEAPIPGKAAVGIEVPNKATASVRLREIIGSKKFEEAKSRLTVAVGKDIAGNVITADLAKMPHLLIAGTTGSGKSVCINSFILSILFKSSPEEVKMLMIDPKVVELEVYDGLPHLLVPVVTDPKKAAGALGWAVTEMEKRYKLFGEHKVRDIKSYNDLAKLNLQMETMPQILIVVDELNDLMMVAPGEVEDSICRLAQKARAAGMNLVIATQRPSVDVLTGLIKANVPSRIALKVANRFDSGTIIDTVGAEKLLGKGDMLFYPVGLSKPLRVQGCWVSDKEIKDVVEYISGDHNSAQYSEEICQEIERQAVESGKGKKGGGLSESGEEDGDEMLPSAIETVVEAGMASTSLLQRKLKLGYARAARIIDMMEQRGIVGPFEGSKPRKVLVTKQMWQEMKMNGTTSAGTSAEPNDFEDEPPFEQ